MAPTFDLQGHRGARGLKPENTLPAFEAALDVGVTTIETDVHLTRDGVAVLIHDAGLDHGLCRPAPGCSGRGLGTRPAVSDLSLDQLRHYLADRNADPRRFPKQNAAVPPLAQWFAARQQVEPYCLPTLADLFGFAVAYAGAAGVGVGKTEAQRARARRVRFDLELKRVPFRRHAIGDHFDGAAPGLLEETVVKTVRAAGMVDRTTVRSFDHRSVRWLRRLEPGLTGAVLVAGTAPVDPAQLAVAADAIIYCPDFAFVDAEQVRQLHAGGIKVVPWTVNEEADWLQLLDWGVDGITTDYPDRLASVLSARGLSW